jgi:hypothetical protein
MIYPGTQRQDPTSVRYRLIALTFGLCLTQSARADETAHDLLQQCLPPPVDASIQARVEIEVTHKNRPAESFHYLRLESPQQLLITPDGTQGKALLLDKRHQQTWRYDTETKKLSVATEANTPLWLLSETLLQSQQLINANLTHDSHNSFAGMDYYSISARIMGDHYARRTLSFKRMVNGTCNLTRAAYFVDGKRPAKKLFFQWQTVGGVKIPKALHIEDVKTLEAVRYHIEAAEVVYHIEASRFPSPPPDSTSKPAGMK